MEWDWQFGDGTNSKLTQPSHLYDSVGNYRIVLNVKDANTCAAMIEKSFSYYPLPNDLQILPNILVGCTPQSIDFSHPSTLIDESYSYRWDFGDGTFSEEVAPNHIFEESGIYTVSLVVISPTGCELTATAQDLITIEPAPIADFYYEPEQVTSLNKTVRFISTSQFAKTYEWQFGLVEGFFDLSLIYSEMRSLALPITPGLKSSLPGCRSGFMPRAIAGWGRGVKPAERRSAAGRGASHDWRRAS
jgi:PKD repeat protein